ncbi:hypothetical protein B0H17DRAFT_1332328 [Mycena rosella]|uniref:CBF1-interacting co-repressor CIR N-terminal domain-containing protein n=1 Tax=Mycena rosella TaxID=1033263 RepID=A0AAD7GC96_MYCRO|nr:hypothetical protein B0H17DRAFT_1332328 [Mycena rosella]
MGGDLNIKKSWHPALILRNPQRVWIEEKKTLEEKNELDQLRKEKEEEHQMQELQRIQEEHREKTEREAGEYLLGKGPVDRILTPDENSKVGAAHTNFVAVQNANNARDAAEVREDSLLGIGQREQGAYQGMYNLLRPREMQERSEIKTKKDKAARRLEKEERKRVKHRNERRSRSLSPAGNRLRRQRSWAGDRYSRLRRSTSPSDRRSRFP